MDSLDFLNKKFPEDLVSSQLLSKFFREINFNPAEEEIKEEHLRQTLFLMMRDYMEITLDPDQLAVLCSKLFILVRDTPLVVRTSRTVSLILELEELDWDLRHDLDEAKQVLEKMIAMVSSG